ncbi:MAG: hypothetical protein L6U16_08850 [Porphyromonadaceae bacterium]|nr:MAG: hypothetical protein L6U16_08850 [Porphyromonadaceae bacterium]
MIRKIFNLVLLTVGTAVAAPAAAPVADSVAVADTVACIDVLDARCQHSPSALLRLETRCELHRRAAAAVVGGGEGGKNRFSIA